MLALLEDIDEKDNALKENEDPVKGLEVQLPHLQKDLEEREISQKQLINDVLMYEHMISQEASKASHVRILSWGII